MNKKELKKQILRELEYIEEKQEKSYNQNKIAQANLKGQVEALKKLAKKADIK